MNRIHIFIFGFSILLGIGFLIPIFYFSPLTTSLQESFISSAILGGHAVYFLSRLIAVVVLALSVYHVFKKNLFLFVRNNWLGLVNPFVYGLILQFGVSGYILVEPYLDCSADLENLDESKPFRMMSVCEAFPDEPTRSLADAAGKGNLNKLENLVSEGIPVNSSGTNGITPLYWSLLRNNNDGFKRLLSLGADPDLLIADSFTVVHAASALTDSTFLKSILEHGIDANMRNTVSNRTPIFTALSNAENLQLLLEYGANVNVTDIRGATPLSVSMRQQSWDVAYLLLEAGADPAGSYGRNAVGIMEYIAEKKQRLAPGSPDFAALSRVETLLKDRGF